MITAEKINKDIARIETLMMLGGKREKALLATLRQDCFHALQLCQTLDEEAYDKQHEKATLKMNNYEVAMQNIRQRWLKNDLSDLRKKELESEVVKFYKPDRLRHQLRFLNYILGHTEIIPDELLIDQAAMSKTQEYHAKQKRVTQ